MISIEEVIHCNNLAEAVAVGRARQSPSGHKSHVERLRQNIVSLFCRNGVENARFGKI